MLDDPRVDTTTEVRTTSSVGRAGARRPRGVGLVVAVTLAFYALWAGVYFAQGHETRDFIKIGYRHVLQSRSSDVIRFDPAYRYPANRDSPNGDGFDGQYAYYIALDPTNARFYLDLPPFRYTRVLYPMVARALALGRPGAVSTTLLLVNWLAIGLGTLAVAAWLRRRGRSSWLALVYGLFPGLLVSFQRDLTEPLAYGLTAAAVYVFDFGPRHKLLWSAALFALAALTRQTTAVFALCYAGALLLSGDAPWYRDRIRANATRASGFLALSLGPLLAYMVFLWAWLGSPGLTAPGNTSLPFVGLMESKHWQLSRQPPEIVGIVLPTLIVIALAAVAWRSGRMRVEIACVLANGIAFVVLLGPDVYRGYTSSGRSAIGVVLASVLAAPALADLGTRSRRALAAAAVLALSLLPAVMVYGLTESRLPALSG
jgi:hypothetical protein